MRRLYLVLALFCVLLVNFAASAASTESSLPALVLDDEPQSANAKETGESSAGTDQQSGPRATTSESEKEPKLIPYETKLNESQPKQIGTEQPKEDASSSAGPTSASDESSSNRPIDATITNKESSSQTNTESVQTTTLAVPTTQETASNGAKDISVLLANKNDSENDLASPTATAPPADSEPKAPSVTKENKSSVESDLDSPVDVGKPNDSRFHYSLGNPEKPADEPKSEGETEFSSSTETVSVAQAEGNKVPEIKDTDKGVSAIDGLPSKPLDADADGKSKKPGFGEATKPVEQSPKDKTEPKVEQSAGENETKVVGTTTTVPPSPSVSQSVDSTVSVTTKQTLVPSESSTRLPQDQSKAEPPRIEKEPDRSGSTEVSSISTTIKPLVKVSSDKPASVPSIIAVALGTALGAAVNPILSKDKDKSATTTSTTTKTPLLSATRKSATDKWDRWTPSSTSIPSTRRRPILPSIRRRFRPYNRFSPFPWGGADSYSPIGGEPEFMPAEPIGPRLAGPTSTTSTTSKPKRRASSTSETPKSTSSSASPASSTSSSDEDEEVPMRPQDSPTTRRRTNGNRRRHHNHHHHHHHHHSHQGDHEGPGRRHHHSSHRHHDREERPLGENSPFDHPIAHQPRPLSPGFGLFNSGPTGTGFDLLNPFSGWLDDSSKPVRPPIRGSNAPPSLSPAGRPGGYRPSSVEGEQSEPTEHQHHGSGSNTHHQHHGYGGHYDDRHTGRDDYHDHHDHHDRDRDHDHHHHHDCHDHHDHHREPSRPHRHRDREPARPPIGGDYDTYPPSSFGQNGRPHRPYNRRDQAESESSEASPSLYGSRGERVGSLPRRVPSILSPFDSLFGALDDELFSLRSSFVDGPFKSESGQTFDALVSSPKISMPALEAGATRDAPSVGLDKVKDQAKASSTENNGKAEFEDNLTAGEHHSSRSSFRPSEGDASKLENPCSIHERGFQCLFASKQLPLFNLFHRL